MSNEQQTTLDLLKLLVTHKASGKVLSWLIGITATITVLMTIFVWNFAVVHYIDGLNYAKSAAPVALQGLNDTRDSLNNKEDYHFEILSVK